MNYKPNTSKLNPSNWLRRCLTRTGVSGKFTSNATLLGILTCAVALAPHESSASLMAYEGFNYPAGNGNLTGWNGGFGWNGVWRNVVNGSSSVQSGSLVAGANAPSGYDAKSIGNSAFTQNASRTGRFLDNSAGGVFGVKGYLNGNGYIGANGKTVYISFLQQSSVANNNYYEFEFHRGDLNDPGRIGGVGCDTGGGTSVYLRTPAINQNVIGPASTSVNFYVVRIDFIGTNDTVTVYQNPTSATEPVSPTLTEANAGDLSFNGISFGAFVGSTTVAHDEVRIGETWADVTSPSASSTGLWTGAGGDNNWSTGGNWDNGVVPVFASALTFSGSTRLSNTNDLTGVSANGIAFDAGAGAFTLNGNSLGLNADISFTANPAAPVTQTVKLPLVPSVDITLNTPANGNLNLAGNVTSGSWLTKLGTGSLTLGGTDTFGAMNISGGTNFITGNTTFTGGGGHRFYIADGDFINGDSGALVIQPGATLTVTGNYDDAGVIGRDSGSGKIIQNGGTFNFAIGNNNFLFVGASGSPATQSEYDMNAGVLNMNGNTLGIALGANASITCSVNQIGGVVTNVGNLYFSPFFTQGNGIYNLTGGSLYIGAGGITVFPGGGYQLNLGGGTVGAEANWSSSLNMTLTGTNGATTFDTGGNTILLSGVLSGPGGLIKAGGGTLEITTATTYTGATFVNTGALQFDAPGTSTSVIHIASGATLNLNYSGTRVLPGLYTNGVALPIGTYSAGNLGGFVTGSGSLQVASSISTGLWTGLGGNNNWSTAGNWDQNAVPSFPIGLTFAGNSRLTNNNDISSVTATSITFDSAAGPFVIGGNDITLNGSIGFNTNPPAPITQTVNMNMAWNADKTIDTPPNGNLSLGGNLQENSYTLTKTDAGTLTLGGSDTFAGYIVNGGTTAITGNVTVSGVSGNYLYLGNSSTNNGTLVIQNGANFYVTGTLEDAMVIGRDGGSGKVIQNGGTFTYNPVNQTLFLIGATSNPGTQAEYDMNGGTLDLSGYTLGISLGDNSVPLVASVNQTGGDIVNVFKLDLGIIRLFGTGIYTLSGGTITIDFGGIVSDDGLYQLNLGGGTIGAYSSWSSSLNMNLTNLNGSVTFSPNGNTITLSGALSGNGGLNVAGAGVLELSGTNTYEGDTVVAAGSTLQLDTAGSSPSTFQLVNGSLLNLTYSGNYSVPACLTNGVPLAVGTYNIGNLPGFIAGSGNLQVVGVAFSTQPTNQVVYLNGNFQQSVTLTSMTVGGAPSYQWYMNGNPIPGATANNLTLSDVQISAGGNYYVVASGGFGSVTSSVVSVTVYGVNNNVFAYDGFPYAAGSVDGSSQNGGFGWNGPWQQTDGNGVIINATGLVGGGNVPPGYDSRSIGSCIEVPSNAQTRSGRFFDTSTNSELFKRGFIDANGNLGANGKTIYLSFLQQPDRTSGFYELEFHKGNLSDPGRIGGIGNDTGGNTVNLRAPNGVNNRSLGAGTSGVNFYVVRIDYKAGNDDVFVYRNPTSLSRPAVPTLTASNVADMSFNGVSVAAYNGPDVKTDEIRLGATWEDALGLAVSNLLPPTHSGGGYTVQFAATPGYTYRLQRATVLTGPWIDIATITAPAIGFVSYQDTNAPAGTAFYRTVTP